MPFCLPDTPTAATCAARFHPYVRHVTWQVPHQMTWHEVCAWLTDTHQLTADHVVRMHWHGGIYLNRERYFERALPATVAAETVIDWYHHESEPERVPLQPEDLLTTGPGFLAVNKPAWLTTQGTRASMRHCLEWELKTLTGHATLMACHRLDRQTSGVVVFGTDATAAGRIMQRFAKGQVDKRYLAIVAPVPAQADWTVDGWLARDWRALPQDRFFLSPHLLPKSRTSRTSFHVLVRENTVALVACTPHTGRTHQLRVHLASSGCPILGDTRYAPPALVAKTPHFRSVRIQLHAAQLTIARLDPQHPHTTLTAPRPGDFAWRE